MLRRIVEENWFKAAAVLGFWPANSEGDDIVVFGNEERTKTPEYTVGKPSARARLSRERNPSGVT